MRSRGPAVVWALLAFVVGMLPAFWIAGPILFGSSPTASFALRPFPGVGLYAVAVLVLSAGGGALAPAKRLPIVVGFVLPMVGVLVLALPWSAVTGVLGAIFLAVSVGAAWLGTWGGAALTDLVLANRSRD